MLIIGCDFHPSVQQVACLDTDSAGTDRVNRTTDQQLSCNQISANPRAGNCPPFSHIQKGRDFFAAFLLIILISRSWGL